MLATLAAPTWGSMDIPRMLTIIVFTIAAMCSCMGPYTYQMHQIIPKICKYIMVYIIKFILYTRNIYLRTNVIY